MHPVIVNPERATAEQFGAAVPFRHVILQPTSTCNLNCRYCYLPDRHQTIRMPVGVTEAVSASLSSTDHLIYVLWHGGEPLAAGLDHLASLARAFSGLRDQGKIRHSLQTNGTLISDQWCKFFREEGFYVGVSLDGPEQLNSARRNWAGAESYSTARRGMSILDANGLKFGVICVINKFNIERPEELYEYFTSIPGCRGLNCNIEEREGFNVDAEQLDPAKVAEFWIRLFEAWRRKPKLRIREFQNVLGWMRGVCYEHEAATPRPGDAWPTVSVAGDVVVLSPEFMGAGASKLPQFIVGNVLERSLCDIVRDSETARYVVDYRIGRNRCEATCKYFGYCGGGQPSNKYFEHGTCDATETEHCRNTRIAPLEAVLQVLERESKGDPNANGD